MDPVVYDFEINEMGSCAKLFSGPEALMPPGYYTHSVPSLLRKEQRHLSLFRRAELDYFSQACRTDPDLAGMVQELFDRLLPSSKGDDFEQQSLEILLQKYGFDSIQHEQIRADLQSGRIGLAQNRLPVNTQIKDVNPGDIFDTLTKGSNSFHQIGLDALSAGQVAVVSLAGGTGSRWTKGAGVVKALNPFCKLAGSHRSFVEIHLAKSRRISRLAGRYLPHIFTTSYLTHEPIKTYLDLVQNYDYPGPLILSPGQIVGLRLIPMARDLRYAWEEMPHQLLDEQSQKMQDSLHNALISWAQQMGEGKDYLDNLPYQCLHPVGHWYEIPNMFRNGVLAALLAEQPQLKYLMMHNIDTVGCDVDPANLGFHVDQGATLTTEVVPRRIEDRGGGLAWVDGQLRLIEGMALPREEIEFKLSYYNSSTTWINIDQLLALFGLSRDDLSNSDKVSKAVRDLAARMPTYITIKDVKKRWGKGQEDIYPVTQFEKLWGDMTSLSEIKSRYIAVSRYRGQQIKEPSQLDGWLRDGSAAYLESICEW
jgi:hypothetical protein